MDLIGGEVGRRLLAHAEGVIGGAARLRRDAVRSGAVRKIVPEKEVAMLGIGRVDDLGDQLARADLHLRPFGFGRIGRPRAGKGLVESGPGDVLRDRAGDRLLAIAEDRARQDEAAAHRCGRHRESGVVLPRIGREPVQIALMIRLAAHRHVAGEVGEALVPTGISGEQHRPLRISIRFDGLAERALQDRPVDPSGSVQARFGNRVQPVEKGLGLPGPAILRRQAGIVEPGVMVAKAERARLDRILAQQPGIMILEQLAQVVGRRGGGGRGEGQGRTGGEKVSAHRFSSDRKRHLSSAPRACNDRPLPAVGGSEESRMSEHVYKVVELVGSSPTSIEDAVNNAVSRASSTLREIRWFEVMSTRGHVEDGKVAHYQVTVKVGFTLE